MRTLCVLAGVAGVDPAGPKQNRGLCSPRLPEELPVVDVHRDFKTKTYVAIFWGCPLHEFISTWVEG